MHQEVGVLGFSTMQPLTDENWNSKVVPGTYNMWLVTFFVPWCHAAQELSPKMPTLMDDLKSKRYNINFGAVDVSASPQLGQYFGIEESPTLKMISFDADGNLMYENYKNDDTEICHFCKLQYKQKNVPYSPVPEDYEEGEVINLDDDNFDDIVGNSNEIWMLKFSAPWCYHCNVAKPKWKAAAKTLGGKVRFALIDADKNRGLAKRFKISKLPTLKYFEAGYNKADDAVLLYSGKREEKNFVEFAEDLH